MRRSQLSAAIARPDDRSYDAIEQRKPARLFARTYCTYISIIHTRHVVCTCTVHYTLFSNVGRTRSGTRLLACCPPQKKIMQMSYVITLLCGARGLTMKYPDVPAVFRAVLTSFTRRSSKPIAGDLRIRPLLAAMSHRIPPCARAVQLKNVRTS